jgi:hypothetical protein
MCLSTRARAGMNVERLLRFRKFYSPANESIAFAI